MSGPDNVRVGTCGWTDPTLIKAGTFYPPGVSTAEERLRFYASQFPLVEVDSAYYAPPRQEQAGLWVDRTPAGFVFNVKAYSLLTGHPTRTKSLPADLRDAVPEAHRGKQRVYAKHLPGEVVDEVWRRFVDALLPLDSAGKLGAVLLQFPEWFFPGRASREQLVTAREKLAGYQVCVEFRNRAWLATESDQDRTLGFLREHELPLVCVDMPQGFRSSLPPLAEATSPALSVVRFHGRDPEAYGKPGATAAERFKYRYRDDELQEWIPRIGHLSERASRVQVLMNNCYADDAVVAARQLSGLLSGR